MFVSCSDGAIIEWSGRTAIKRVTPDNITDSVPQRVITVAGHGVVFAASRYNPFFDRAN